MAKRKGSFTFCLQKKITNKNIKKERSDGKKKTQEKSGHVYAARAASVLVLCRNVLYSRRNKWLQATYGDCPLDPLPFRLSVALAGSLNNSRG